ncbi:MAG: stage II sporulation protein P [Bacillota bacterium]
MFLPGALSLAGAGTGAFLEWSTREPQKVVNTILPVWMGVSPVDPGEIAAGVLVRAARADLGDPARMIAFQMSLPVRARAPGPVSTVEASRGTRDVPRRTGAVTIGIYHTHTGETYELTDGVERVDGQPGAVVEVGRVLKRALQERHGLGVVHSEKVHDVPYSRSYLESEQTARRMIEEHPELKMLIDLHRDSLKDRAHSVTEIGGQEVATILVIVGSDARQSFPDWEKNYELARAVAAKSQELYPGLCVGVRVKEGRYNQFLHPGALLVEVGSVANHTEEALRTAELLADILAAVLADNPGGDGSGPV